MDYEDIKIFKGKTVFIKLKSGTIYNAKVIRVNSESIIIIDKFESNIVINLSELSILEEKKGV